MIKIALVSYLNTKPFIDGLEAHFEAGEVELMLMPPADCAKVMAEDKCDLALVPVAAVPDLGELKILKDFCIGANGKVDSVFLCSQTPVEDITQVILDPHSKTSNALTRILLSEHWKVEVDFISPEQRSFDKIRHKTAGVAIGDTAFRIRETFPYVYDLSEQWKVLTGLPFVFAVWVSRPGKLTKGMKAGIAEALRKGTLQRKASAEKWALKFGFTIAEAVHYLEHSINYNFDDAKHLSFLRFIEKMNDLKPISEKIAIQIDPGGR